MNKDLLPSLAALRNVCLTHAEKERMVRSILALPPPLFVRFLSLRSLASLSVIGVIVAGSTVSYAAESALPGDFLYPIKVNITEPIRGSLTFSARSQADWHVTLAGRRLEEGERLIAAGQLSDATRGQITLRFEQHAKEVAAHVDRLLQEKRTDVAASVSADFEAALRAHAAMFARFERQPHAPAAVRGLLTEVQEAEASAQRTRRLAEAAAASSIDSGAVLRQATEITIEHAQKRMEEARTMLRTRAPAEPQITEEAAAKLKTAAEGLRQGRVRMDAGAVGQAFDQANAALSIAQEARLMLKTANARGRKQRGSSSNPSAASSSVTEHSDAVSSSASDAAPQAESSGQREDRGQSEKNEQNDDHGRKKVEVDLPISAPSVFSSTPPLLP